MKYVKRIALALTVIVAANILLWPPENILVGHNEKCVHRLRFENCLVQAKPQIILLGNSILRQAIEPRLFADLTGTHTVSFARDGSASAYWYLTLKNIIAKSPHKPSIVAIFFRDEFLTRPDFRVKGEYKLLVHEMANDEEPLLDRLAYPESMGYPSYLLNKYSPLYQKRNLAKESVDSFIKHKIAASILGREPDKIDEAITNVFARENLNRDLMTRIQTAAELNTKPDDFDFDKVIDKSFLPHMINIAKEDNIKLVFVRVKRRRDLKQDSEPGKLKSYIADLKSYLEKNNLTLLDFTHDGRLKLEHFADGDHLDRETGRILFTELLAQQMKPIIRETNGYDQVPIKAEKPLTHQ